MQDTDAAMAHDVSLHAFGPPSIRACGHTGTRLQLSHTLALCSDGSNTSTSSWLKKDAA